jgi:2-succinyl-6-hydroxy-2,4-cyclohexadiene-1-carboxylate synthase
MFECLTLGSPTSCPLIFLHGLFGSKEEGIELCLQLKDAYYCVLIDLPGHHTTPYSEQILGCLNAFVRQYEKPVIVGYSMGGRLSLQLQEEARAVIAISAHPGLRLEQERKEKEQQEALWQAKLLSLPLRQFFKEWYTQPLFASLAKRPPLLKSLIEKRLTLSPLVLHQVMQQLSLVHQPCITTFTCPTLFLYGKEDWKYQQLYTKMDLPSLGIDACGHACHIEQGAVCGITIFNWLTRLCTFLA